MVYGALAAKGAGAERIVLHRRRAAGASLHAERWRADEMPAWRYGQALRAADAAVFHNRDDLALLKRLGLVAATRCPAMVAGAGVDLEQPSGFCRCRRSGTGLVFLMIASLDRRRGVIGILRGGEGGCASAPRTLGSCLPACPARARSP